jgi:hypothetical protein
MLNVTGAARVSSIVDMGKSQPIAMNTPAYPPRAFANEVFPALVLQVPILVLAGMILDGGGVFQACAYALAGFWGGVGVLRLRRRGYLSRLDSFLIRYGYILACIISFFVTHWIWRLRGYGDYL